MSETEKKIRNAAYEVWTDDGYVKSLPTLDQAREYARWIRHNEGKSTAIRRVAIVGGE